MTTREYEYFDRQVERKMRWSSDWFSCGWSQMVEVAKDKVSAGVLEQRFNDSAGRLEFRAV